MANECFWAILIELSYLPRWLVSKPQTDPLASSFVTRPDQSLTWGNLVYSHCVCVGVFGNFAEKAHQTDVPTDIKGNCEEPATTLRESSCVSLCKRISKYSMHRYAISLSLFSRYFVDPDRLSPTGFGNHSCWLAVIQHVKTCGRLFSISSAQPSSGAVTLNNFNPQSSSQLELLLA